MFGDGVDRSELYLATKVIMDMSAKSAEMINTKPDTRVLVLTRSKQVARGKLEFVGGKGGQTRKLGGQIVGAGKSIVLLDQVVSKDARVPISFKNEDGSTKWSGKSDTWGCL